MRGSRKSIETMRWINHTIRDIVQYLKFILHRRSTLKQAKKDDPNIYPLY